MTQWQLHHQEVPWAIYWQLYKLRVSPAALSSSLGHLWAAVIIEESLFLVRFPPPIQAREQWVSEELMKSPEYVPPPHEAVLIVLVS